MSAVDAALAAVDLSRPAYVVIEVLEILDRERATEYAAAIPEQMAARGGRAVGSGLATAIGDTDARTLVIQHWPSGQAFLDWQAAPEYAPLLDLRDKAVRINAHIVPETGG